MTSVPLEGPDSTPEHRRNLLTTALEKALNIQGDFVARNIARARQRNPDATPKQVIDTLEKMYRAALAGTGAAVGAVAAAPGVGTAAGLALAGGEVFSSLELSALFALSVAEVHGIRVDELERRRTLVLGFVLGGGASQTIEKVAGRTGPHWAKAIVEAIPVSQLKQINKVLGYNFVTKWGTKQGIIVLGEVVPFGIGAAIGGGANLGMAELAVRAARRAFGPAPAAWPKTLDTSSDPGNEPTDEA